MDLLTSHLDEIDTWMLCLVATNTSFCTHIEIIFYRMKLENLIIHIICRVRVSWFGFHICRCRQVTPTIIYIRYQRTANIQNIMLLLIMKFISLEHYMNHNDSNIIYRAYTFVTISYVVIEDIWSFQCSLHSLNLISYPSRFQQEDWWSGYVPPPILMRMLCFWLYPSFCLSVCVCVCVCLSVCMQNNSK